MKTKTITISVQRDVEERFRRLAGTAYGRHKGYLGKAVTEAMQEWERKKMETDVNVRALEMLKKGFKMGKWKFNREELYAERFKGKK